MDVYPALIMAAESVSGSSDLRKVRDRIAKLADVRAQRQRYSEEVADSVKFETELGLTTDEKEHVKTGAFIEETFRKIVAERGLGISKDDLASVINVAKHDNPDTPNDDSTSAVDTTEHNYSIRIKTTRGIYVIDRSSDDVHLFDGPEKLALTPDESINIIDRYHPEELLSAFTAAEAEFFTRAKAGEFDPELHFMKRADADSDGSSYGITN